MSFKRVCISCGVMLDCTYDKPSDMYVASLLPITTVFTVVAAIG